ncbi:MAG TPA: ferredoxin [Gemmatimonadales bacterium]|nr:ferredoxin [Gemmatimonadales bacterium]
MSTAMQGSLFRHFYDIRPLYLSASGDVPMPRASPNLDGVIVLVKVRCSSTSSSRSGSLKMKLKVDSGACTGHGRCYTEHPDLFDADDDGCAVVLARDAVLAPEWIDEAEHAEMACPERAISLSVQ